MKRIVYLLLLMLFVSTAFSQPKFRSGVFLHHSTGGNIWGPNGSNTSVPQEITSYNTAYGYTGSDACEMRQLGWPTNPWNNEWERWHRIFDNEDPDAIVSQFFGTDRIIMIKSCYPSSAMTDWGSPADTNSPALKSYYNYKWHWRNFIRKMAMQINNFFVVWTNAPLVEASTNDNAALLSHHFCRWAKDTLSNGLDPYFGDFPENVYVFDFFHYLAGADNKLRPEYAESPTNSHPNAAATELVAPILVEEIFDAAIEYESSFIELLPPEKISPEQNAIDVSPNPTLKWKRVPGAIQYGVQLATDMNFNQIAFDGFTQGDTTIEVTGLAYNRQYNWRVRSVSSTSQSVWSGHWTFTTAQSPPDMPVAVYPDAGNEDVEVDPEFRWQPAKRAAFYDIQVADNYNFSNPVIDVQNYSDTSFTNLEDLDFDTRYYWHVRAGNNSGKSDWCGTVEFRTAMPMAGMPVLIEPEHQATDVQLDGRLVWSWPENAESFEVIVESTDVTPETVVELINYKDSTYEFQAGDLAYQKGYNWMVRANNRSGQTEWTEPFIFTTLAPELSTPELYLPEDGAVEQELMPEFTWGAVENAEFYLLQIVDSSGSGEPSFEYDNITNTSFTIPDELEPFTDYYWRVRAGSQYGISDFAALRHFKTMDPGAVHVKENLEIRITPNPCYGSAFIEIISEQPTKATIIVNDIFGNDIYLNKRMIANQFRFTANLPAHGVYFVRIIAGGSEFREKIINLL